MERYEARITLLQRRWVIVLRMSWSACCAPASQKKAAPSFEARRHFTCSFPQVYAALESFLQSMVRPFLPAETWITSPGLNFPWSSMPASGFCNSRWITRFSGRAP